MVLDVPTELNLSNTDDDEEDMMVSIGCYFNANQKLKMELYAEKLQHAE